MFSLCAPGPRRRSPQPALAKGRVWWRPLPIGSATTRRPTTRRAIARLRAHLVGQKTWGKADEESLSAECHQQVEAAVERYLAIRPRSPETMFDHLYAALPRAYRGQRDELKGAPDA
jgi:hypothetical protein